MQEEQIQPENQIETPTPDASDPFTGLFREMAGDAADEDMSWLESSQMQELRQKYESGEWSQGKVEKTLRYIYEAEGRTYDYAKKMSGAAGRMTGLIYRGGEKVAGAIQGAKDWASDPAQEVREIMGGTKKSVGKESEEPGFMGGVGTVGGKASGWIREVTGSQTAGTATKLVYDVGTGFVIGLPYSIVNLANTLVRGEGDADVGDILDVSVFAMGVARGVKTAGAMKRAAGNLSLVSAAGNFRIGSNIQLLARKFVRDALVKNKKAVYIPRKLVKKMLNDPLYGPALQRKAQQIHKSLGGLKKLEHITEFVNLFVQNEELLHELLGYGGQVILTNAMKITKSRGIDFEQALDLAAYDFAREFDRPAGPSPKEDVVTSIEDEFESEDEAIEQAEASDEAAGDAAADAAAAEEDAEITIDEEVEDEVSEEQASADDGTEGVEEVVADEAETDEAVVEPDTEPEAEVAADEPAETEPSVEDEAEVVGPLEGTPDRIVWGSNRKSQYRVKYELRELGDVQPSHNLDGTENPNYDKKLQPREQRGSTISFLQINKYANDINTDFLLDHFSTLTDGAPILSKKSPNNVLSGNARTLALLQALQNHQNKITEDQTQWEKYQEALREKASEYGITEEQLNQMQAPVLVQVLADDVDEVGFADDANRASGLESTSAEQANRDATYLKDDVMVEWNGNAGQTFTEALNHPDNQEFRQKLFQNIPLEERNAFLRSEGDVVSEGGARRIRNMMLRYVFQGDYGIKMSEILIESGFDEIQNINNMLEVIIPHLALFESYVRVGRRDAKYAIAEELARAVGTLNELAKNEENIHDFFRQLNLFQPKTSISQLNVPSLQMLYIMDHRKKAYQQLASVFLRYIDSVLEIDPGISLFEEGFSKQAFFQHQMVEILWDNPTQDLQLQLDAASTAEAKDITRAYVSNLMGFIEKQAEDRGMQPEPQPEPEAEQEAVAEEDAAAEEVLFEQRNPLDMTADEIAERAAEAKTQEDTDILKALGSQERVNEFNRLMQKHGNDNQNPEFIKEFGELTPEQEQLIFGVGDKRIPHEEWLELEKIANDLRHLETDLKDPETKEETEKYAFTVLSQAMLKVKPEQAKAAIALQGADISDNLSAIKSTLQIREVLTALRSIGHTQDTIAQGVSGYLGTQLEANDVADMLTPWFAKEQEGEQAAIVDEGVEVEEEPEVDAEEERGRAYSKYQTQKQAAASDYFRLLLKDFQGEEKLPRKVEFAEKYTIGRNAPSEYNEIIDELFELRQAYENESREQVETEFGAHVLSQYDKHVAWEAANEIRATAPKLIDYKPKTDATSASRTYAAGEKGDIFIKVTDAGTEYLVHFDIPGYEQQTLASEKFGRFTDKQARAAINDILFNQQDQFVYGDNPRTNALAPTEQQQRRIEKMPPIVEETAFKDKQSNSKTGMAYGIPGLDPAMRIKTMFKGDNQYDVYIESDMVNNGATTKTVTAENPLDAVQRALANRFDDSVWDGLHEDPEPNLDDPLDSQGVAGNMPSPLPANYSLKPVETEDGLVWFRVTDENGKETDDYSITVDPDPLGLNDGTMEVTVRFPNHPNLDAIIEIVEGATVEEATIKAISNLMGFEVGKGGLASASGEAHVSSNETLLESLPPPVKSSERPFGDMFIDRVAMERGKYAKTGNIQIYAFKGKHAPQVTLRKLGTKEDPMWGVEIRYPRHNAAAEISYAKTAEGAINDVIKRLEESDQNWKPLYKHGIISEIDSVQNAINRRQFATTPAIERRVRGVFTNLRKGLQIDLRGYKITSNKELAVMGQLFRHPGLERHIQFYLNERYEIVGHDTVSFGVPGQTVNPSYARTNYHMRKFNAKYFINMHNHPGGPAIFSDGDKSSSRSYLQKYQEAYLGQVVVNSGEYAESLVYKNKNGDLALRHRNNIGLSEADLGWKTETQEKGFFRMNLRMRPGDPLYQYDVNSETGKLLKFVSENSAGRATLANSAKYAKYLQTELNWTTIFFKGYNGEIIDVKDFKDLHLLSPAQLWSFIEGEARWRGGIYVDVFIGKGDWYSTKEDIANSSWHQVLTTQYKNSRGKEAGIQFAWFDGIQEKDKNYGRTETRPLLSIYESESARSVSGKLHETVIDSDYGVDTGLTEPSENREAFINDILTKTENGEKIDTVPLYEHFMGNQIENTGLIVRFKNFVQNQFILNKGITPNEASPTDAGSTHNEVKSMENNHAFLQARLGAITPKDRVLTIGDDTGSLATYARTAGAASVETTNTDGYVRTLFSQILPDVADAVHNIDADNLSREWTGQRPTVILLNAVEDADQKLDEALKILAPNGRIVFFNTNQTGFQWLGEGSLIESVIINDYLKVLGKRSTIRRFADGTVYVIDKHGSDVKASDSVDMNDTDALFAKVEEYRHARQPMAEADVDAEFTGVSPSEQTFSQPISNPSMPAGMQLAGESLPLPPADTGTGGAGQISARPTETPRSDMDIGNVEPELEGASAAAQGNVPAGMSPATATTSMAEGEGGVGAVGEGDVVGGENVDTDMAGEFANNQMPLQEGQDGQRAARTPVNRLARPQRAVAGSLFTPTGISGYETGVTQRTNSLGIPVTVVRNTGPNVAHPISQRPDPDAIPDNTPIGLNSKMRSYLTGASYYTWGVQTGKKTLELMGKTGRELVSSLKRIRIFGDKTSGQGTSALDTLFPEWKPFVRNHAKANGIHLRDAYKELNEKLIMHHEGRSNIEAPDVMDKIAKQMLGFLKENFETPMIQENQMIFKQGHLFDMDEGFVDKGYLKQEHRNELEKDRHGFDKFMRSVGQQTGTKGVIQGFVQDNQTGGVYAVFLQTKTKYNKETKQAEVISGSETYILEDPFGNKAKVDENVLAGEDPDYTLVASRDPARQKWTDRDVAKHLWDSAVSDGLPDPIRDAFEGNGVQLPVGAKFIYSKKANVQQWKVVANGRTLYVIKRLVPAAEKTVYTPDGNHTEYSQIHPAYSDFTGKLLVYKASEARDPIFIFKGHTPHKVWSPIENYFPHIIDWSEMSDNPDEKRKYARYLEYAQEVADANQIEISKAREALQSHIQEAKTKKYGNLEQSRQLILPNYDRDYFKALEYYIIRGGHRLQTIKEFGQQNDLLEAKLNEMLSDDNVLSEMDPVELAVIKLRYLAGYRDYVSDGKLAMYPFRQDNGNPIEFIGEDFVDEEIQKQHDLNVTMMSPADWQALLDAGILETTEDGKYRATLDSVLFLENPAFLKGSLAKGAERISIATDIIMGQLGWKKGDIFDEIGKDGWRNARQLFGLLYLGRAYIPNMSQSVNTGFTSGWRHLTKGIFQYVLNPKHRETAQDVGAYAIDAMHEFGSVGPTSRALHQLLGATPRYQVGKLGWKSLSPMRRHWDDPSVKTIPWSAFFKVERTNRALAALAGRSQAASLLKKIVRNPKGGKFARARLLALPHAYDVEAKLDAALRVPDLSTQDVNMVRKMNEQEVRQQAPHLFPVYELFAEYAKEMADFTQHRVESLDRNKWMRDSPILMTMNLFKSFSYAQTKLLKDRIGMEWGIAHDVINNKTLAKGAASAKIGMVLIPHIILATGIAGIGANILGSISRRRTPDEDDLNFISGIVQAGGATTFGEIIHQLVEWNQGAEEILLGPGFGSIADVGADVVQGVKQKSLKRGIRTPLRLMRPPTYGPSAWQFLESITEETSSPKRITTRRSSGSRRSQRRLPRRR